MEAVLGTGGVAAALVEPSPMLESPKLPQSAPAPADEARVGGDGSGAPDTMASKAPHLLSSLLISETTGLPSSAPATSPVFSELPQSSLLAAVGAACGVAAGMAGAGTAAAGARAEAGGARDGVGTGVAATEPPPKLPHSSLLAACCGAAGAATLLTSPKLPKSLPEDGAGAVDVGAGIRPGVLDTSPPKASKLVVPPVPVVSKSCGLSALTCTAAARGCLAGGRIPGIAGVAVALVVAPKAPQTSPP